MSEPRDFGRRDVQHIRIDSARTTSTYEFPKRRQDRKPLRADYAAHARSLLDQLAAALPPVQAGPAPLATLPHGALVEIETLAPAEGSRSIAAKLSATFEFEGIAILQSARTDQRSESALLFVSDAGRAALRTRLSEYGRRDLGNQARPDLARFENLEVIRAAEARRLFPPDTDFTAPAAVWWELWVREAPGRADAVANAARDRRFDVHPERLQFPDTTVVYVHTTAANVLAFAGRIPGALFEVRRDTGTVEIFLDDRPSRVGAADFVADLAVRIVSPPLNAPTICVLDTGVTAAHALLAPGLAGAWAYDDAWGADDHHPHGGHGTGVATLALYGDLFASMNGQRELRLTHTVESMKYLTPRGFPAPQPPSFGAITQGAVAKVETERPGILRAFCLASATAAFAPSSPSSWSGALDQLAAGATVGDQPAEAREAERPYRLILVAAGNVIGGPRDEVLRSHPIEDPAQSWNALTVGGYTAKETIEPWEIGLKPLVAANHVSPFSCGSNSFTADLTPIKPEVLFEAGNMAVDAADECGRHPSLSLLTAGRDAVAEPLIPFEATSAAVGVAGSFIGGLQAALPDLWPESHRALAVQSAHWPGPIQSQLIGRGAHWKGGKKSEKQRILREVGYGLPNLNRAILSARNDLTLLAEATLQPFARSQAGNTAVYNDMHFYDLPWPRGCLEDLENEVVTMKVTLSYFIEPNLTGRAATRPDTYRSFGLRFEMKKRTETLEAFKHRVNAAQDADGSVPATEASCWLLGPKAISAGSLHCDLWRGYAIDLAAHDAIAIYPVGGWWKSHVGQRRMESHARYALAISIDASGRGVDLAAEVEGVINARAIAAQVAAEVER